MQPESLPALDTGLLLAGGLAGIGVRMLDTAQIVRALARGGFSVPSRA